MSRKTKRVIRIIGILLFIIYITLLAHLLFFSENYGRVAGAGREYRYNLAPFAEILRFWTYRDQIGLQAVVENLAGNVLGFIPFGFMLPVIAGASCSGWFITFLGFSLSLLVETLQLLTRVGSFDVDDLLLNTTGVFLGYLMFVICNRIRRKMHG